jgi:ATP-dependent protease HslVU (ClpYQ) peptidase subunit
MTIEGQVVLSDDREVGYGETILTRRVAQVVRTLKEIRSLVPGSVIYSIPRLLEVVWT